MEGYVPYSAAWFTLALVNAGLAQGKGRSGLGWWGLSLFLGPLATLLVVASPTLPDGQREQVSSRFVIGALVAIAVAVGGLVVTNYITR